MNLSHRLLTIVGKTVRLLAMLVLIKWFGADGAACIMAGLRSCRRIVPGKFLSTSGKVRV